MKTLSPSCCRVGDEIGVSALAFLIWGVGQRILQKRKPQILRFTNWLVHLMNVHWACVWGQTLWFLEGWIVSQSFPSADMFCLTCKVIWFFFFFLLVVNISKWRDFILKYGVLEAPLEKAGALEAQTYIPTQDLRLIWEADPPPARTPLVPHSPHYSLQCSTQPASSIHVIWEGPVGIEFVTSHLFQPWSFVSGEIRDLEMSLDMPKVAL